MTELELQRQIVGKCAKRGLWTFVIPDSQRVSRAGWVDIVILGPHGALFVELKSEDGRRSVEQINVAKRISEAGLSYRLWRPDDWRSGLILLELDRLR